MAFCPKCGVELDGSRDRCPLCKCSIKEESETEAGEFPDSVYDSELVEGLTPKERKKITAEVVSVAFGIAVVMTFLINLWVNRTVSWSLYPIVSLVFLWTVIMAFMGFLRKPWIVYAILAPSLVAFLFCLDVIDTSLGWFLDVGLPLVLVFDAVVAGTMIFILRTKRQGMNLIAIFLLGIDVLCLGVEGVLANLVSGFVSFGWSLVVTIAIVPISAFFFYLHYRITNQATLRKIFRL